MEKQFAVKYIVHFDGNLGQLLKFAIMNMLSSLIGNKDLNVSQTHCLKLQTNVLLARIHIGAKYETIRVLDIFVCVETMT